MDTESIIKNKIVEHQALTFDDILLLPNYADIKRQDVDLRATLHPKIQLKIPVVSSPMDTVTESAMAITLAKNGALGIIHRNLSIEEQAAQVKKIKQTKVTNIPSAAVDGNKQLLVGGAVGVGTDLLDRVAALVEAGVDLLVVDSAHGYSKFVIETVELIRKKYPQMVVMAGNIATFDGAKALIKAGAHILRVGMGPGSICTTRIVTGMGVPQISAIAAVVRAASGSKTTIVADGGIRQIGDMAKALAFGAHAVMMGSLFARFDESPGEKVTVTGKTYKSYRGMGSVAAMKKGGAERYGQGKTQDSKKLVAEGIEGLLPYQGSVVDYLYQIEGSLRSSLYYLGSHNLATFFKSARAIKISNAGLLESHPHGVVIKDAGKNYQT